MKQLTKAQELEKLNQIIEIINEAGPGSYLAMSFEGFEALTRDNIESDFGRSYPSTVAGLETRVENLVNKGIEERKEAIKKADELRELLDAAKKELAEAEQNAHRWHTQYDELNIANAEMKEDLTLARNELDAARIRITELKAQLYDYMMASANANN